MAKKNSQYNAEQRASFIDQSVKLGKSESSARKAGSQTLVNYISRQTGVSKADVVKNSLNNSFNPSNPSISPKAKAKSAKEFKQRLGLNREELIEAVGMFPDSLKNPNKSSSERLEEFLYTRIAGIDEKIQPLTQEQQREIRGYIDDWGVKQGINYASYFIRRSAGAYDKNNFLRLTVAAEFASFYDGPINHQEISELMKMLPDYELDDLISGIKKQEYEYVQIFTDYADLLRERDLNGTRKTMGVKASGKKRN